MKTFPALFAAEKNKKTGIAPTWILKLSAGGTDYYLSDNAATLPGWQGGITTLPWIGRWGQVQEGVSGALNEIRVADLEIDLLIDPDASPNAETLALAADLEQATASLYLWLHGLNPATDPPQEFLRGHVSTVEIPDDLTVRLVIEDETARLQQYLGNRVTRAAYPDADPDDIGKIIPIVYGSVKRLPALAVSAGIQTSLPSNIGSAATSITVSDAFGLAAGQVLQIDDEQLLISAVTGDTLTVSRGHNTTIAVSHLKGAVVWEVRNHFAYLVADHPVTSIDKIYGRVGEAEVDITTIATAYTGQPGEEHIDYPAQAVVTMPGYITVSQAVSLLINDGLSISDTLAVLDGLVINDGTSISDLLTINDGLGISDGMTISDLLTILDGIGVGNGSIAVSDTIGLSDGISVSAGSHAHSGTTLSTVCKIDDIIAVSGSWFISADYAIDGNLNSGGIVESHLSYAYTRFKRTQPFSLSGTPSRYRWVFVTGDPTYTAQLRIFGGIWAIGGGSTKNTYYHSWNNITSWAQLTNLDCDLAGNSNRCRVWEVWIEVEYNSGTATNSAGVAKSGTVSKTGGASIAGSVAKSGTVGRSGSVSRSGSITRSGSVSRTGSVSKTGTVDRSGSVGLTGTVSKSGSVSLSGNSVANTLVGDTLLVNLTRAATVPQVFTDLLSRCGALGFTQVGSLPGSYAINGAITEHRRAIDWLDLLAWHLRCWFRVQAGTARLILRPDSPTSVKTLPACRIDGEGRRSLARHKTPLEEIINRIAILYDRDWSQRGGDDTSYRAATTDTHPGSITNHGERERPELFRLDFCTGQAMAESLRDFYLATYQRRRWIHQVDVYLDHSELEFADAVTLGFLADQVGTIQQARFSPGDITRIDTLGLVIEV